MEINLIAIKEILDLEKELGCELVVKERANKNGPLKGLPKYYVHFKKSGVKLGTGTAYTFGNGETIDEAIEDYCCEISSCTLIINLGTEGRKEIQLPNLIHTKLLNL